MLKKYKAYLAIIALFILVVVLFFLNRALALYQFDKTIQGFNQKVQLISAKFILPKTSLSYEIVDKGLFSSDLKLIIDDGDKKQNLTATLDYDLLGSTLSFDGSKLLQEDLNYLNLLGTSFDFGGLNAPQTEFKAELEGKIFPLYSTFKASVKCPYLEGGKSLTSDLQIKYAWGELLYSLDVKDYFTKDLSFSRFYVLNEGEALLEGNEDLNLKVGLENLNYAYLPTPYQKLSINAQAQSVNQSGDFYDLQGNLKLAYEDGGLFDVKVLLTHVNNILPLIEELSNSNESAGKLIVDYLHQGALSEKYEVKGTGDLKYEDGYLSNLTGEIVLDATFEEGTKLFDLYAPYFEENDLKAGSRQSILKFDRGELSLNGQTLY